MIINEVTRANTFTGTCHTGECPAFPTIRFLLTAMELHYCEFHASVIEKRLTEFGSTFVVLEMGKEDRLVRAS